MAVFLLRVKQTLAVGPFCRGCTAAFSEHTRQEHKALGTAARTAARTAALARATEATIYHIRAGAMGSRQISVQTFANYTNRNLHVRLQLGCLFSFDR